MVYTGTYALISNCFDQVQLEISIANAVSAETVVIMNLSYIALAYSV